MDVKFFENDIVCQIFNINLNKTARKKKNLRIFQKVFQEYFPQKN
jgi:hypothetical protein